MRVNTAAFTWLAISSFMAPPAYAAESSYLADVNGCRVYDQSPMEHEVVKWSGACKDGLADGFGKVEWIVNGKLASYSEGTYKAGKLYGHGVIHYSGGEVYEGELFDGTPQGHGVRTAADGTRREGEFNHGVLPLSAAMKAWFATFELRLNAALSQATRPVHEGMVVIITHLDASKKVTSWEVKTSSGSEDLDAYVVDGANRIADLAIAPTDGSSVSFSYRYGKETPVAQAPAQPEAMTFISDASGCQVESPRPNPGNTITWTGACKDGFLDGAGVLTWPNAQGGPYSIEATFVHGQALGQAIVNWSERRRYTGELTHNSVTGVGILTFLEGYRYEGDFVDGKFQGQGKLTYPDHAIYVGGWYQDMRVGPGDFVDADGGRFQGMYLNNVRVGYGILDPHGRVRYAGRFVNDKPTGSVSFGSRYGGPEPSLVEYRPINLQVESYKPYRQLTPDEKAKVDAQYPSLAPGDAPPYPAHGLLPIYHELLRLESLSLRSGVFSIVVHVDAAGRATKVDVVSSPDDDLSKDAIEYVLRQQFTPALCGKIACEMTFPLAVSLGH